MKKLMIRIMKFVKKLIKGIMIAFLIFLGICVLGVIVDYIQVIHGNYPVFTYSRKQTSDRIDIFQGVLHSVNRKIKNSNQEPFLESEEVVFQLFSWKKKIKYPKEKVEKSFQVNYTKKENCQGKASLYYADLERKVYTYCLEDVEVSIQGNRSRLYSLLEKSSSIIEEIDRRLSFKGVYQKKAYDFISLEDGISTQGLRMFRCINDPITDIYIGDSSMTFQEDFCTDKDDDLKFIFDILDETPKTLTPTLDEEGEVVWEVFYRDDSNEYSFELPKSNYIYITAPEVRGKKAKKIPLKEVLEKKLLTIEELKEKGLIYHTSPRKGIIVQS